MLIMNHINGRIEKVVRYCSKTKKEFAEKVGKSSQWVTNIISEGYPVGKKTITAITDTFPNINPEWLFDGSGTMLLTPDSDLTEVRQIDPDYIDVELVSKHAQAGYMCGYGDNEYLDSLPKRKVIIDRTIHGNYKCFEVKGDSMFDNSFESWLDGDILLAREVQKHLWLPKLHMDKCDFVIIHKDGIVIKRIVKQDNEKGTITLHSLNEDKSMYPDYDIYLNDVFQIFAVVKLVDRQTRR